MPEDWNEVKWSYVIQLVLLISYDIKWIVIDIQVAWFQKTINVTIHYIHDWNLDLFTWVTLKERKETSSIGLYITVPKLKWFILRGKKRKTNPNWTSIVVITNTGWSNAGGVWIDLPSGVDTLSRSNSSPRPELSICLACNGGRYVQERALWMCFVNSRKLFALRE